MAVTARSDTLGDEDRCEMGAVRGAGPAGQASGPALAVFDGRPAAAQRTLIDVLDATVRAHPEQPALDDGRTVLSYRALAAEVENLRARLAAAGIGAGDRVGVRVPSGTNDLYLGILAVLAAGAAYVPVDAEDPDERAELVFAEAGVRVVLGAHGRLDPPGARDARRLRGTGDRTTARPPTARTVRAARRPKAPTGRTAWTRRGRPPRGTAPPESRATASGRPAGTAGPAGDPVTQPASATSTAHESTARPASATSPARGPVAQPASAANPPQHPTAQPASAANPPHAPAPLTARTVRPARKRAALPGGRAPGAPALTPTTRERGRPLPRDDAWVIFTSGSTGRPKGVAVTHRSAAAFVDAEAGLFLRGRPIGPGDRVLAGLSVAFDASCEEMWLARRNGACLVPVPRERVRAGADLGPWLARRRITVVSTVPTLAALWLPEVLDAVRLLVFGGEACPPELAGRLATGGREVWNTYGPTEATVVSCAARLTGEGPVRIGLPLDGWRLAVVDEAGAPVAMGGTGQLVIGGAGLGRYLDPALDAEKYAPLASLGWARAYRSGDLVRAEPEGLVFLGRGDEQVKIGGRRIELGEVDAALRALPGVAAAAAAVRTARGGRRLLVGYVVTAEGWNRAAAVARLRARLPAALVPLLAPVDALPTRTSGKVDRDALPWLLPAAPAGRPTGSRTRGKRHRRTEAWLAARWNDVLGVPVADPGEDFFALGGGSLAAAQLAARLRERYPQAAVLDVYRHPTVRELARALERSDGERAATRTVRPVPARARMIQLLLLLPLFTVAGLRWCTALLAVGNVLAGLGGRSWAAPTASWWLVGAAGLVFLSPPGRLAVAAGGARLLLRGLRPGRYPRGGGVHLRLWAAERLADLSGATSLSGAWLVRYARALGARVGPDVDLHALPPVSGMLRLGRGCAVEAEVDLSGHWLDGDRLEIGPVRVGRDAVVGTRSILLPGARVGKRAQVVAGSSVTGRVPAGERWGGAPAVRLGRAVRRWPARRPARRARWAAAYGISGAGLALLPVAAGAAAVGVGACLVPAGEDLGAAVRGALLALVPATLAFGLVYAALLAAAVRLLGLGLRPGWHPLHSRVGWQAWTVSQLMDAARETLFPLYAGLVTPLWLRALGMRVGSRAEVSTVLALPSLTTVGDGAFLADDALVAPYQLGGGWLRIGPAAVGARAFLGNSGMTAPGRSVPDRGLVGVLSATPKKAKKGRSYLGMPPVRLPRTADTGERARTYEPPVRLLWARGLVEGCRLLPVLASAALAVLVVAALAALARYGSPFLAMALSGAVLVAAGTVAGVVAVAAKWLLAGRFRAVERPLWSGFVWRDELADTFVEVLAVPWLVGWVPGTPVMSLWLRALGASVGRGVWCESYWLPEADLVTLEEGVTVNRGCVLQTHLFHDRIMRTGPVVLRRGATLGPGGIMLPGSEVGAHSTLGPASLVLRGESVPAGSRWLGNPARIWRERR